MLYFLSHKPSLVQCFEVVNLLDPFLFQIDLVNLVNFMEVRFLNFHELIDSYNFLSKIHH